MLQKQIERPPSAGRRSLYNSGVRLAYRAELFFDRRDQFLRDRVAIRAVICRIDAVTIGEKGTGLDKRDGQKSWEFVRGPFLEKLITRLNVCRCPQSLLIFCTFRVFVKII